MHVIPSQSDSNIFVIFLSARGDKSMARFVLPVIHDNKNGWGPSHIPEQFKDTPYQPFSKGDRLGKVSDSISNYVNSSGYILHDT